MVLSRRVGEEIVIGDNIRVTVLTIQGDRVRFGILAPRGVLVRRQEVQNAFGEGASLEVIREPER